MKKNHYGLISGVCKIWKSKFLQRMRIAVLLILISITQTFALDAYAQNKRLSLDVKNETIIKILEKIEDQSEFYFMFDASRINVNQRKTVDCENQLITNILDQLLEDTGITYSIKDRQVLLTTIAKSDTEQQNSISGKVTDSSGSPLPGVTVVVKGTTQGTVTNADGEYSLANIPDDAILQFTFVGMKSQEIPFTGKTSINVMMELGTIGLEEVVAVGYGVQKKINLTGAVDQVSSGLLKDRPVPNITRAIQGAIPNLNIRISDGRPIANPTYNIRGTTSIGAGGNALILIDGVAGDPLNLNPNDIESITVLKDAASAAVYGARAVFGVVLIKTKSGNFNSKTKVTYSGSISFNKRTVEPEFVWDSYTWAELFKYTYNGWNDYLKDPSSVNTYMSFSNTYLDSIKYRSEHPGQLPEVTVDPQSGKYVYYGNTNWYDLLYVDIIPATEHSLNISGGDERFTYAISGRYYYQDGLFQYNTDKYNKYNLRFNGGIKINSWLKLTNNMDFSLYNYREPMTSIRSTDVWTNLDNAGFPMAVLFNPDGNLSECAAQHVGDYYYGKNRQISNQSFIKDAIGIDAALIKNKLNLKSDFSFQSTDYVIDQKVVPVPFSRKPNEVIFAGRNFLKHYNSKSNYYAFNIYSDFTHQFGDHNFKILVGENIEINNWKNVTSERDNLILPDKSSFNLTTGQNIKISDNVDQWATMGIFYRCNYDFKNKYLLELDGRYDGSSKFPATQRFGFFPSFSAGWRITEEDFMMSTRNWLDNLKIRASYGTLGNGQISSYRYIEQIKASISSRIINGSFPTYVQQPTVLPDGLTWEKATTLNLGTDFSIFHNRLSTSFDWYTRDTKDMITSGRPLPGVFGASVPVGNYADLSTKGFEFSIKWSDMIKMRKPLSYSIRVTLSDSKSHITNFYNPTNLLSTYYNGMTVGEIWGYVNEGFFTSQEDIDNHANQSFIRISSGNIRYPGDIKFKDLNNDNIINNGKNTLEDHGDLTIIGNSQPRYTYSINTDLEWNNFSFSIFFQGVGQRDWYPDYGSNLFWGQYGRQYSLIPKHTLNHWTEDNPDAYFPRYRYGTSYYGRQLGVSQTKYLQNAAYIRLKDLSIGYTFPRKIIKTLPIENLRLYFSGQNLWVFSPMYKNIGGIDPETIERSSYQSTEGDSNVYPMLKTYTFGINLTF